MDTWTLRIIDIRPEDHNTKTIFVERTDGPLSYQAGQFLTLLLQIHGREHRRSYSFSTAPGIDPVAAITVKRVPNGEVSRYLLDHLRVGDILHTLPPAGRFTLAEAADPLVFIAAGSGIVPVFSLLKTALPHFYLCGPPAFMRMAQFTLRLLGFPDEQIKKENFTVEYVPPPPLLTDTTLRQITIHQKDATFNFEAAWPDTILQAAERRHISLPYSCRGGRCSTCTAKCLSGKVKMSINEVLTEKELKEGWVLTCVGYAETDITLKLSVVNPARQALILMRMHRFRMRDIHLPGIAAIFIRISDS